MGLDPDALPLGRYGPIMPSLAANIGSCGNLKLGIAAMSAAVSASIMPLTSAIASRIVDGPCRSFVAWSST
jgi:hypothetical protein